MKFIPFLLVFFAGGLGSVFRFVLAHYLNKSFPLGTLFVNLVGAFLIGFVMAAYQLKSISEEYRLLFAVGFAGGFTTFSAFVFEMHKAFLDKDFLMSIVYAMASLVFGLLMVAFGWFLGNKLA